MGNKSYSNSFSDFFTITKNSILDEYNFFSNVTINKEIIAKKLTITHIL